MFCVSAAGDGARRNGERIPRSSVYPVIPGPAILEYLTAPLISVTRCVSSEVPPDDGSADHRGMQGRSPFMGRKIAFVQCRQIHRLTPD